MIAVGYLNSTKIDEIPHGLLTRPVLRFNFDDAIINDGSDLQALC
jgi:hypothetical protein